MRPIRTLIRQAIIQQLQASKTLKAKIQSESHYPIALQELPLVAVSLDKATILTDWSALDACGQLVETIEQPIQIKITAAASNELEEQLEELAAAVSQVLAKDETLGDIVKALRLEEDADINISAEGEQPIGVVTLRFIALYRRQTLQLNTTCN